MIPDDIRDIRGPIAIPYWWIPLAVAAGAALAIALGYAVYRYVKRARRARVKSPSEVALERIDGAKASLATTSSAAFSSEVSDAVRAYLEAEFDLRATRQTTEEFLHGLVLNDTTAVATHRAELEAFLEQCDLAKFARLTVSSEDGEAIAASARAFVVRTASRHAATKAAHQGPKPHAPTIDEGAHA